MRVIHSVLGSAAAIALFLAGPAHATSHPANRNGFMIGFGIGGASLGLQDGGNREGSGTVNFRIGGAVRPDLVIHYEGNGWARKFTEDLGDVTWTFNVSTAAVTYYPPSTGIFLRGGIGIGSARVELDTFGGKLSHDESGLGFLVAGGYEWRLSKKFALAPAVEYSYMDLDALGSADMIGGSLGFNWYW